MTVEFDEPGEYGVVCNEYCGSGHHDMEGELIVHPEDEFTLTELAVDAPESVAPGDDVELEATIDNRLLEDLDVTLEAEIGDETFGGRHGGRRRFGDGDDHRRRRGARRG